MKKLLFMILVTALFSCKTTQVPTPGISTSLLGVVFDNKSNAVQNAKLSFTTPADVEFLITVNSDIDGKFLIPELDFGEYDVVISAKNCKPTTTVVDHFDIENVLIVKIYTFDDLLIDFEKNINNKNLDVAKIKMQQLDEINSEDIYLNYIRSTYYIKIEEYVKAENILIKLLTKTENSPYVNLLLADIYQHYLIDTDKSIFHLEQFLNNKYRLKETNRLEELKSAI
ncbi:MAG: carboxypeptidase-like regulatory domain-containing protein [Spirochaetaceae bacterium]